MGFETEQKEKSMKKTIGMILAAGCMISLLFSEAVLADAAVESGYNYQDAGYYVVVNAPDGYVNFRYGPGLEYGILFPIYNGEILYISTTANNLYDGLLWGQTEYEGNYGWGSISQTSYYEPDPEASKGTEPDADPQMTPSPEEEHFNEAVTNTGYLVSDAYYHTEELEYTTHIYAIPYIHLDSMEIQQLNETLYHSLYSMIQDAYLDTNPAGELLESSYIWHVNDDLLSLVLYTSFAGPWHEYQVYNISISEERILDNREFLYEAGWAESQYTQRAEEALAQAFDQSNQEKPEQTTNDGGEDKYNQLRQETLSIYNIAEAMPYMNGEGQMCMIGKVYLFQAQLICSWMDLSLDALSANTDTEAFYVTVSTSEDFLELRSGPGTAYSALATVYSGQKLSIIQTLENKEDGQTWGKTAYNGLHGWIPMNQTQESRH